MTFVCSESQLVSSTFLSASGSFLQLPLEPLMDGLSVRFQFRTWNREALLLSARLARAPERLVLLLTAGQLRLTHHRSPLQRSDIAIGEEHTHA